MSFNKRKFISAAALALAVGSFSGFVSGQDSSQNNQQDSTKKERKFERRGEGLRDARAMHGGKHGDRRLMRGINRLNLTDAQREQIRTIFETQKSNQAQREEIRGLMKKKRDGSITEQEQARLREIKTQMKASAEQTHNAVLAVLTSEQRTQLEQMKQERSERRGWRRAMKKDGQTPDKPDEN